MAKPKIFLSSAAHATDNPTKCPGKCSENTHCNAYMDLVEKRLKQLGFNVKRGDKKLTGDKALSTRVAEANKWKADLYYVAHTNAGGGRYSMTMCYPDSVSIAKAKVIQKHRKFSGGHKVVSRSDLYEINQTAMICLYDELFFHDNATDCAWFHNGGIKQMVEETVQAICEICGVKYTVEPEKVDKAPTVTYRVRTGGKWLPAVKNLEDYAGIVGNPITDVAIKVSEGSVKYRVHIKGGGWLPYVTGYSIKDYNNGYAGNGKTIDAIQVIYTPKANKKARKAKYRISPISQSGYWPWQTNADKSATMDGYAGVYGFGIDLLQIVIE